ncbi:MAG: TIR domain-containing protein, partial [Anaerolineae bacterium]|nr:TIR domain-containing protein [Anaerolineae bacterium]
MSHIFISYSKDNIDFARHLRHLLQDAGFAVWMDETGLVPSERWWSTIDANIRDCAAFIVIMSPDSQESRWVEREILVAEEPGVSKPIFPVLLAGQRWSRLADVQYEDMTAGLNATLSPRFVTALAQYAPRNTGAVAPPPPPETAVEPEAAPDPRVTSPPPSEPATEPEMASAPSATSTAPPAPLPESKPAVQPQE